MKSSSMTLIYYFVPEDNESQDSLNAFVVNKPLDQISEEDIHANFPLQGEYRLSFRIKYNRQFIFVLQDASGPREAFQKVPTAENKIVVKANRVSWIGKASRGENREE